MTNFEITKFQITNRHLQSWFAIFKQSVTKIESLEMTNVLNQANSTIILLTFN